jgi:3-hydroxymyristoyl/3-hydroxydecanoyl-(acyl carrier protein) dehydratase
MIMDRFFEEYLNLQVTYRDAFSLKARGVLSPGHPHLDGHFEGCPLLPGVSQIDLIEALTALTLDQPIDIIELSRIKFAAMFRPHDNFEVEVKVVPEELRAVWQLNDGNRTFSKGSFTYELHYE